MRNILAIASGLCLLASAANAEMNVQLLAPWDGNDVPPGQQCTLFNGNGATPPFQLTGIPEGTVQINVEYNDKSYGPLADDGGHGIIGYPVDGASAMLISVPGLSADLGDGIMVVAAARSGGQYASLGYLPPCSGGRGNQYSATVKALSASGAVLAKVVVPIGRY